jgi:hypothetical protein
MSQHDEQGEERGELAGRLPSLEEQTPGLDTAQVAQTDADAEAFFANDSEERGEQAGRLPSLEEQTPGLDTAQVAQTDADAEAFFATDTTSGEQASSEKFAQAAGDGTGADEGLPPAGDVRTVYENERAPGEATPTKQ